LAQQASEERHPVMWTAPVTDEPANRPPAAVYIPLLWGDEVLGVLGVENHTDRGAFLPEDIEFLAAAANQIALFVKQQNTQQAVKWQELMRHALLYQFSPQIANLLVERGHLRLQKETVRPVAVLLATLRGFAALSSSMGADGVVQALDEIFSIFVPILSTYNGSLEKNSGESFLAVFEPAGPGDTTQGERALRAAWDMQRTVRRLEDEWQRRGWLACDLGIGLHAGEVLAQAESRVGNTFYPTLDELIEQTSRYSEAAERGEIVISQTVFARLFATVDITPRIIQAKGAVVHPDIKGYLIRRVKDPAPTT
jgi:class 3 adenylate cyclase